MQHYLTSLRFNAQDLQAGNRSPYVTEKSGKTATRKFTEKLDRIVEFTKEVNSSGLRDQDTTWAYEAALMKTYVAFEQWMLHLIVTAINNDTSTISEKTGIEFPKNLKNEVCEYLVTGGAYFDFRGRSGLISTLKKYLPNNHWLVEAIRDDPNKGQLDRMIALRNFAAHESKASKHKALEAVQQQNIGSAGAWIKRNTRFIDMIQALNTLANDISVKAPY